MKATAVVLFVLVCFVQVEAQTLVFLTEPDSAGRPKVALVSDGITTIELTLGAGGAYIPFAIELDDGTQNQLCAPGFVLPVKDVQVLMVRVEGGTFTGVTIDGTHAGGVGVPPNIDISRLRGRHQLSVNATTGTLEVEFEVVGEVFDLGAVPGSFTSIREVQEPPEIPAIRPTPPLPPTPTAPAQVTLTPEAARIVGNAASMRGITDPTRVQTFAVPAGESRLFVYVVDQYGRLVHEGSLILTCPDDRWKRINEREGDRLYNVLSFSLDRPWGVVFGETFVVSLEHDRVSLATVTTPPAGQGLWLPIVVQR